MSDPIELQVKLALVNARVALQNNNKMEARRWATHAAKLDPNTEEAWLILGAVSSPAASLAYIQRALEINPQSERAIKGMQWALKRLQELPINLDVPDAQISKQDTQPIKITRQDSQTSEAKPAFLTPAPSPAKTESIAPPDTTPVTPFTSETSQPVEPQKSAPDVVDALRPEESKPEKIKPAKKVKEKKKKEKKEKKKRRFSWLAMLLIFLFLLAAAFIVWAALPQWEAMARSASAPLPSGVLVKPSLTPTSTNTPTPTPTATPTLTPTPTATFTPLPTNTPWPTSTPAPVIYNTPVPVSSDLSGHWIDIDLSQQMLYAYDGDTLVNSFVVSTGTSAHPTVTGTYYVYVKYRYSDMTGPGYYLPDVPYTMYFYSGYAIHGTYWHNNFGTPMSHGCVNMRTSEAGWIFDFSEIGTPVVVHY